MKANHKTILVCDCEGTMAPNGKALAAVFEGDAPRIDRQLCRAQIDHFKNALKAGGPLIVGCTQQAPLFDEIAAELSQDGTTMPDIAYVNIRERAGWSKDGAKAGAKMAALIAEAALDIKGTPGVTLQSQGRIVVIGGEAALEATLRLASKMEVTCLLRPGTEAPVPKHAKAPIFSGRVERATGHLGDFRLNVAALAEARPSSKGALAFDGGGKGELTCDLIFDVTGDEPLFAAGERREGYFRADPKRPAEIAAKLFDIVDMIGEFEKPRYVRLEQSICAHARNSIVGCNKCIDACPTSAIVADGDAVSVDPYICVGHGACASVCPTGAIAYDVPSGNGLFERLRVLLGTYAKAGGADPVLLIHDTEHGEEMIALMATHGRGLPAHVLPFAMTEVTRVGIDVLLAAMAYGASGVHVALKPSQTGEMAPLEDAAALTERILSGLGYGAGRIHVAVAEHPDALEAALYEAPATAPAGATFALMGGKRQAFNTALKHLHAHAPAPVDRLALDPGAPFGAIAVDEAACTLCLACVSACPAGAIGDNPDKPLLRFLEKSCVQCGLCRATCPEKAIALEPRIDFTAAAAKWRVLKEEEPFRCIRCDKPFGSKSTIEHMVGKLADHPMFSEGGRIDLIRMCDDCRVSAQFEDKSNPFAAAARPRTRTTDDYLREREAGTPGPDEDTLPPPGKRH